MSDDAAAVGIARQIEELLGRQLIAVEVNVMLPGKLSPPLLAASGEPMMPREKVHRRALDAGLELFAERIDALFRRHIVKELFEQSLPRLVQRLAVGERVSLFANVSQREREIMTYDKSLGYDSDDTSEN